jgi:hypothetical protein
MFELTPKAPRSLRRSIIYVESLYTHRVQSFLYACAYWKDRICRSIGFELCLPNEPLILDVMPVRRTPRAPPLSAAHNDRYEHPNTLRMTLPGSCPGFLVAQVRCGTFRRLRPGYSQRLVTDETKRRASRPTTSIPSAKLTSQMPSGKGPGFGASGKLR